MISGALNIGFPSQCIDATAGHPHISQQELNHGHGPDVLDANRMLGPSHCIHDGASLTLHPSSSIHLIDL